jgi:UDPglucose 6-dehydrogenase
MVGCGYVGLVTACGFASLGHDLVCVDSDPARVQMLREGRVPFFEPGLTEMLRDNYAAGRLTFTTDFQAAVCGAEFVFLAVNTPEDGDGRPDLTNVWQAVLSVRRAARKKRPIVVVKSTVPIGTTQALASFLNALSDNGTPWRVVVNPEFLSEGQALKAFLHSDRVILGGDDERALREVASLYEPFDCPVVSGDFATAETIKYASNAFLATKLSFINEIAFICESLGVDVREVARGIGLDRRIGPSFLKAGVGFGGSCLPKDTRTLVNLMREAGEESVLLQAVMRVNDRRRSAVVDRLRQALGDLQGRVVALWGLAFKPGTDDIRDAPSLAVIRLLLANGATVRAYDPMTNARVGNVFPEVTYCRDALSACEGADALVLLTEWQEFKSADLREARARMRGDILLDGRYVWRRSRVEAAGFRHLNLAATQSMAKAA